MSTKIEVEILRGVVIREDTDTDPSDVTAKTYAPGDLVTVSGRLAKELIGMGKAKPADGKPKPTGDKAGK